MLWTSDGTPAGTHPLRSALGTPVPPVRLGLFPLGETALFWTEDALWTADGTDAGTFMLAPLPPAQEAVQGGWIALGNGELVAALGDGRMVRSDGNVAGPAGTTVISGVPVIPHVYGAAVIEDAVLVWTAEGGLWRVRLADGATEKILQLDASELESVQQVVSLGERAIFTVLLGGSGNYELWTTDGTAAGTRRIDGVDGGILSLIALGDQALFTTGNEAIPNREIWRTDGTAAGTRLVRDLLAGEVGSQPHDLTPFGGAVYFFALLPGGGEGLWRTDGTAAGTTLVLDLSVAGLPSWGRELTVAGGRLFFALYNGSTGAELWASRGDAASTALVTDLRPGAPGSYPQALTAVGGAVVFAADDGETGLEPWRSDGTAAGTRRLGDINPGRDASSPGPFTPAGRFVFTGAWEPTQGREPWAIPLADLR